MTEGVSSLEDIAAQVDRGSLRLCEWAVFVSVTREGGVITKEQSKKEKAVCLRQGPCLGD